MERSEHARSAPAEGKAATVQTDTTVRTVADGRIGAIGHRILDEPPRDVRAPPGRAGHDPSMRRCRTGLPGEIAATAPTMPSASMP